MRHRRLRAQLSLHVDGMLDAASRLRLEAHLADCQACRRELDQLRRTVELLRDLPAVETPPNLANRVMATVRERESPRHSWIRRLVLPVSATAVSLAALFVFQGVEIELMLPGSGAGLAGESVTPAPSKAPSAFDGRGGPDVLEAAATPSFQAVATRSVQAAATRPEQVAAPSALPPMSSCLTPAEPQPDGCARWHSWLLGLGTRDAPAFLAEMDLVPPPARDRWIGEISNLAVDSGSAIVLVEQLREMGDPRASVLAGRFEPTPHR